MKKKTVLLVLQWLFVAGCVMLGLEQFPSVGSGLLFATAILAAPIPALGTFLREKLHVKAGWRVGLVVAVFVASALVTPSTDVADDAMGGSPQQNVSAQFAPAVKLDSDASKSMPTTQEDEAVSTPEPDAVESVEETPETASEPVAEVSEPVYSEPPAQTEPQERTVYVGDTGECYHSEYCRTLKGSKYPMSISDAIASGRRACKVCGG
nr:MAG TPA: Metal binding domain of Ada [Caudoviricetes sp.]